MPALAMNRAISAAVVIVSPTRPPSRFSRPLSQLRAVAERHDRPSPPPPARRRLAAGGTRPARRPRRPLHRGDAQRTPRLLRIDGQHGGAAARRKRRRRRSERAERAARGSRAARGCSQGSGSGARTPDTNGPRGDGITGHSHLSRNSLRALPGSKSVFASSSRRSSASSI